MKTGLKSSQHKENIAFLAILVFSALFYLFNINFSDIWIDESFTKALISHSFADMLGLIKNDFHPPLYFYGLKLLTCIAGISTFTIRLFSVIGVLSTLVLGYVAGQRVFGKKGALYFCLLLLSLPMLASYSHDARMYTWAAFSITGVFFYSWLYISTNKKSDLFLLALFTLIASYTHYFGLIAAFSSNMFVLVYLLFKRNNGWRSHFVFSIGVIVLYLPWLSVLLGHTSKAQVSFWVPEVSWYTILSCFTTPFAQKFWMTWSSYSMVAIIYILFLIAIYRNFKRNDGYGSVLGLSVFIFGFTVMITAVISQFSQPILYSRYIMTIVTMLMVTPTVFFITCKFKWLTRILLGILVCCGLYTSFGSSYFSFGPYRQSMEYLPKAHPEVKKILHVIEITTGPLLEYSENAGLSHYWLNNEKTIVYTNLNVFKNLHQIKTLNEFLNKDEVFCMVSFEELALNKENLNLVLSESDLIQVDTITDNKIRNGFKLLFYILRYKGKSGR
jgi:4-amino-4-deoxy-L-arabinose transferase-like glycosyltransferase